MSALFSKHAATCLEKSPAGRGGYTPAGKSLKEFSPFFAVAGANGQPWKSAEVAPPKWGAFPLLMSLIKGLACLRVAKEKVDDCTAATRASREFVEITTVQPSIARYRVNASARNAPASRPRIAEMIMRRARAFL